MKYKNTKTGFIFETSDEITGKDWVKLSPDTVNMPEEDAPEKDEPEKNAPQEEEPQEEEPEEKPKRKRAAKE